MPREARINKLLSKEVTEREEEMILNSAFLINKNKVAGFLNTVEGLKTRYADKGLFFDCTGPWPPYNFCDLLKERSVKWTMSLPNQKECNALGNFGQGVE